MRKLILKLVLLIILTLISAELVQAAATIDPNLRPENEPFDIGSTLKQEGGAATGTILILQILAGGLLYFAAPLGIIFIVLSGLQMVVYGAESDKLEQAKKNLTWSIVGLLVIIMSYSLVRIVIEFVLKAGSVTPPA